MSLASVQGSAGACRSGEEAGVEEPMDGGIPAQVMEARKYAIDSALVRILKARKTISHNDLIAEVTHQLNSRFSATPQVCSKSIIMHLSPFVLFIKLMCYFIVLRC